jgi:hypothetical protein
MAPSTGGGDGYWPIFVPVALLGLLMGIIAVVRQHKPL